MSFSKGQHPKVFISYSHDSPEHKDRVLYLSDRLRGDGIDCHIDQYEVSPPEGWPHWMINQIEGADFVLVICTEQYDRRFRGKEKVGKGLGGKWEGAIITQELYDAEGKNIKFIPVVFSSDDEAFIPLMLRGATHYKIDTEEGYEGLYRNLSNQPKIQKPDLGKLRPMPPLSRKQDFSKLFAVPYPRNPFFTGREEFLEEIHVNLISQGLAALTHGSGRRRRRWRFLFERWSRRRTRAAAGRIVLLPGSGDQNNCSPHIDSAAKVSSAHPSHRLT